MSDPAHPQRIDFSGFEAALRRRAAEQAAAEAWLAEVERR